MRAGIKIKNFKKNNQETMELFNEFKKFAIKGNVMELAVAVVIGSAFGKIVTSFVNDILMPPIGVLLGGTDFSYLSIRLNDSTSINYGSFLQTVVDFVIIAFSIFMVLKAISNFKKKEEVKAEEKPSREVELLSEIRDALKK